MRSLRPVFAVIFIAAAAIVRVIAADRSVSVEKPSPAVSSNYVLRAGDLLRIQVFQEPDLDRELRVAQDGTVVFPLIKTITVAGMTVPKLEAEVVRLYDADYLVNPQINITVLQYAERHVNVMGAVNTPGAIIFPSEEKMTLLDAVTRAGGFSRLADRRHVRLTRIGADGEPTNTDINADALIKGTSAQTWVLQPDDIIYVPENWR